MGEADYDTVRVTNARTTRIFTLAPSALGGIISIRELESDNYYDVDNTDTWYGYDRLGNVALTTDSSGDSNGLRWQDAYGNQLAAVTNGSWASAANADGYGLTTKEYDGDVELYYFWQRWYDPSLGVFITRAPFPPQIEHPYSYVESNPINSFDPNGQMRICCRPVMDPILGVFTN